MRSLIMMESLWGSLAMGCTWKGTIPRSCLDSILYICILIGFQCAFSIFKMVLSFSVHICLYHVLVVQMAFYDFADGAFRHTLNLTLAAWVLYSLAEYLVSSRAICIGPATNKITEYEAITSLLTKAASQDVHNLVVLMDSQLVVFHLNHIYTIRNPVLLCLFRRVCLLKRSFETITYRHIHR